MPMLLEDWREELLQLPDPSEIVHGVHEYCLGVFPVGVADLHSEDVCFESPNFPFLVVLDALENLVLESSLLLNVNTLSHLPLQFRKLLLQSGVL